MSFNWNEYLIHARELWEPNAPKCECIEALHRSCISRAYYSIFIQTRNRLQDAFDKYYDCNSVHEAVRQDLRILDTDDSRELGNLLLDMSRNRNKADYDNSISKLPNIVKTQLTKADAAIKLLTKI